MSKTEAPVVIVTGASSGIGQATARAFRGAGFRVFGTSRRSTPDFDGITMLTCDVTSDGSVLELIERTIADGKRIDVLVNNAGSGLLGAAEESSMAQAERLFDVNFFGVLRMTNAVLPIMRRQGSGRIINVSSVLGLIPAPYSALYASTKHAIEGYSESLDHELRSFGIRAVLIEPAYTRTSFGDQVIKPDRPLDTYNAARAVIGSVFQRAITMGEPPEIVADTILKAAIVPSPKARYAAGRLARRVSFLRRFVPATLFDKSLRKQNGLPA